VAAFASAEAFFDDPMAACATCVIVDVYLRGTSGLALQRTLAERQVPIPIIFLTGRDDPALARQAREAGAVAWLIKPVLEQDLWQAIKAAQHQTGP
jgi:FixJ family two-component response regulator